MEGCEIASSALKYTITPVFCLGAESAWVDSKQQNKKAIALNKRIGMEQKETPAELFGKDYPEAFFFEIRKPSLDSARYADAIRLYCHF